MRTCVSAHGNSLFPSGVRPVTPAQGASDPRHAMTRFCVPPPPGDVWPPHQPPVAASRTLLAASRGRTAAGACPVSGRGSERAPCPRLVPRGRGLAGGAWGGGRVCCGPLPQLVPFLCAATENTVLKRAGEMEGRVAGCVGRACALVELFSAPHREAVWGAEGARPSCPSVSK